MVVVNQGSTVSTCILVALLNYQYYYQYYQYLASVCIDIHAVAYMQLHLHVDAHVHAVNIVFLCTELPAEQKVCTKWTKCLCTLCVRGLAA